MCPSATVPTTEADGTRETGITRQVVTRTCEKQLHGQVKIPAVFRNRQFMPVQEGDGWLRRIAPDQVLYQSARIERTTDSVGPVLLLQIRRKSN